MHGVLGRFVLLIVLSAVPWSPTYAAENPPSCPSGSQPVFAFGFASLQARLGSSMGDPTECEHVDPTSGDTLQRTTTGLALYRRDTNTAMFTNGREHWALTPEGMAHWSGWHGSAAPAGVAAPRFLDEAQAPDNAAGTYTPVEAVTIVDVLDEENRRIVVQREDATFLLKTDGGCSAEPASKGGVAFVVSPDTFAGPSSRLILTLGGGECQIVEAQAR